MAVSPLPQVVLQVAFTGTRGGLTVSADPNDPTVTPIWTDLSARLTKVTTKRGKTYELDTAQALEHQFEFLNADGFLDPTNTASPYSPFVIPLRQYRLQVVFNTVAYTVSSGYIEAWPQTWNLHGTYGRVQVTAIDALGVLSQIPLSSCLASEMLLDNPAAYWPLTEPSGATVGANIAATSWPPVAPVQYGAGGTAAFGGTTLTTLMGGGAANGTNGPFVGNSTGVLTTPASLIQGLSLESDVGSAVSGATTGYTLEAWVQTTTRPTASTVLSLVEAWAPSGQGEGIALQVDSNGHLNGVVQIATANGPFQVITIASTGNLTDGQLHHVAVTMSPTLGMFLYLDGVNVASTASVALPAGVTRVSTGYDHTANQLTGLPGAGFGTTTYAHIALYTTALTASRISNHHTAGATAFSGEDSGARFKRILAYGPWNGGVIAPAGNSRLLGAYDLAGKSVMAALLEVVVAENGNMYADNLGNVVFEPRNARYTQLQQAYVFGEAQTAVAPRTNLCPNPSFEVSTAGWSASGFSNPPTIATSTAQKFTGLQSMAITWQAGGSFPNAPIVFPTVPGNTYSVRAQVYIPTSGGVPVYLNINGIGGGATVSATGAWVPATVSFVATGTSHQLAIEGTGAAGLTYIDAVLIEAAPTAGSYFDGSTPSCTWNGTPGLSTSTMSSAGGEMAYEESLQIDLDPHMVYNAMIVQRPGGVIVNASDPASLLKYFPRGWPTTPLVLPVYDDATAIAAAQYLIGKYKDASVRVSGVQFKPVANPALWAMCLSIQIGQRVGLARRPPSAPKILLDLFVESVGHTYDAQAGEWTTDLELSPAYWQNYGILTAARGPLAAATASGATTVTVTVPNDAAGNTAAQQGWNASAITAIQIVDPVAGTETVTVTAMSIAGTTVTITTTATAHAHAAGVVVAENPGASVSYNQFDSAAVLDGQHRLGY